MSESMKHQCWLVVICAVIYLPNLGATHLWDEDEAYFASTAREMSNRGDLIVPYFNGQVSLHKPALMYWVMISSFQLFGVTEFATRIGSVAFALANVLLVYNLARLLFTQRTGFWSALVLGTSIQFVVIARGAVADQELLFFCTLPLLIFVASNRSQFQITRESVVRFQENNLSWKEWAFVYSSMAVGSLAKGPVAIILPTAVIGLFLLLAKTDSEFPESCKTYSERWGWFRSLIWPTKFFRTCWEMRPITALLVIGLIAGPWYVAVGKATNGEWLRGFFLIHNVGRFTNSFEGHAGGLFFYLLVITIGTYPWAVFFYPMPHTYLSEIRKGSPHRRAYLLISSCCAIWIGAFTLAGTKLPHYVLPAYPAISILFGRFIVAWLDGTTELNRRWMQASWINLIVVGSLIVVGVPFACKHYLPGEEILACIGVIPLFGGLVAFWAHRRGKRSLAVAVIAGVAIALPLVGLAWGAPRIDKYQKSHLVAQWLQEIEQNPEFTAFATFQCFNESLVFYCNRNVKNLDRPSDVYEFLNSNQSKDAFLLTTVDDLARLKDLPGDFVKYRETPRFLKPGRLVLLGRKINAPIPTLSKKGSYSPLR